MKVINIHKRIIPQPKAKISALLGMSATEKDQLTPTKYWPATSFKEGLQVGSKGGHGPLRYTVSKYDPGELIQFEFTKPKGFHGFHSVELTELEKDKTELKHTINMHTTGIGTLTWTIAIRWLHDLLIEKVFDKVENHFKRALQTACLL